MDRWENLREMLKNILGSDEVYFQPPPSVKMKFPCIVVTRENDHVIRADNKRYVVAYRYSIQYIRRPYDTDICEKILELPYCSYDRFFTSDGLNHDNFVIYY